MSKEHLCVHGDELYAIAQRVGRPVSAQFLVLAMVIEARRASGTLPKSFPNLGDDAYYESVSVLVELHESAREVRAAVNRVLTQDTRFVLVDAQYTTHPPTR
jgi:hypothetical protein